MTLLAVFLAGLLAGGTTCAAVQGGLLAGTAARRRREQYPAASNSFGDDFFPVAEFLFAKLIAHVVVGALLGTLGSLVQINSGVQATAQFLVGILLVVFALDMFGVKFVRAIVPTFPASWSRVVRRQGKRRGSGSTFLLGLTTVLIPCGVTMSMELLAITSGSPLEGAAIMGVFVVGTMPLFAIVGYVARKSATAVGGKLLPITGIAVLCAALFSINSGLVLVGSPVHASTVWDSVQGKDRIPVSSQETRSALQKDSSTSANGMESRSGDATQTKADDGIQHLQLQVSNNGYSPKVINASAGIVTDLTLTSKNVRSCSLAFVLPSKDIELNLPSTGTKTVQLGSLAAGTYRFSCSMGMYTGKIVVA